MDATGVREPEIKLHEIANETPFELFRADKMGPGRQYFDTVALKGTFDLAPGRLVLSDVQEPIVLADDYWNPETAERSSLRVAGELLLHKPNTDVIVTGHVHAPGGEPLDAWDVSVEVSRGTQVLRLYQAHVVGPHKLRFSRDTGWVFTRPQPARSVPIRYELAYGGAYISKTEPSEEWVSFEANPSGVGYTDEDEPDEALEHDAPQWYPDASWVFAAREDIPLAGLGPVPRSWPVRLRYAGTYDDAWLAKARKAIARGIPADYARDFDPRFFQCANPGLVMPGHLVGDEEIELTGVMPSGEPLRFQLPRLRVIAFFTENDELVRQTCVLDTIHVDVDAGTVMLTWRLTLAQKRNIREAMFDIEGIA